MLRLSFAIIAITTAILIANAAWLINCCPAWRKNSFVLECNISHNITSLNFINFILVMKNSITFIFIFLNEYFDNHEWKLWESQSQLQSFQKKVRDSECTFTFSESWEKCNNFGQAFLARSDVLIWLVFLICLLFV